MAQRRSGGSARDDYHSVYPSHQFRIVVTNLPSGAFLDQGCPKRGSLLLVEAMAATERLARWRRFARMGAQGALHGDLPLYLSPPSPGFHLHVADVEDLAWARLLLLEADTLASGPTRREEAAAPENAAMAASEGDVVAHFLLRLACCGTSSLRTWFLDRELRLFDARWASLAAPARRRALASAGFRRPPAPAFAATNEASDVVASAAFCAAVPWAEAPPSLVAKRCVVLRNGIAFVPESEAKALLRSWFADHLRTSLAEAVAIVAADLALPHVAPPLRELVGQLTAQASAVVAEAEGNHDHGGGFDGGAAAGGVELSLLNFDCFYLQSFPPCMRQLVTSQRRGKHLKFQGRVQLRPFLREAGLGFHEAVRWWQRELCRDRTVSQSVFLRDHLYHVRHAYGLAGSGRLAFALGCRKIIDFPSPLRDQVHGCPFKHAPAQEVAHGLTFWGLPQAARDAVQAHAADGRPMDACEEVFRATHPGAPALLGTRCAHPNEYLRRSRRYYEALGTDAI